MRRFGIIALGILWGLLPFGATAQEASRIGLQVELGGSLRTVCVPAGGTVAQVEQELSASLVEHIIASGYWNQFCWTIEPYNPADAPQGLLKITLDPAPADTEVHVTARVGPIAVASQPFAKFELLEGRATSYPRGELLRGILKLRFTEVCLEPSAKEEELHHLIRSKIRVGTGIVTHSASIPPGEPQGVILLPWQNFNTFGQARFKFRYLSANGLEELESEGLGLPGSITSPTDGSPICCLLTRHQQDPSSPPLQEPVDVFLDMTCQEIMFLRPPVVQSCTVQESSAVTVPLSE